MNHIYEDLRSGVDGCFSVTGRIWVERFDYRFNQPWNVRLDHQRTLKMTPRISNIPQPHHFFRDHPKPTFRIKNASICINDFLCCTSVTCKISIESAVMTSGVLFDTICRTALLAAAPTFNVVIPSFFVCVDRVNRDRRSSITSTYDCQVSKPLEQRSIARTLQMGLSSLRYIEIDLDTSVRQLRGMMSAFPSVQMKNICADLGDSRLYFSTAIEPQMNAATTEVNDGFSTSGR